MGENNVLPKHKLPQIIQKIPRKAHIPPNLRNSDYIRDRENQWRSSGEACAFPDATIQRDLDEGGLAQLGALLQLHSMRVKDSKAPLTEGKMV